jgi:hypothetical protein
VPATFTWTGQFSSDAADNRNWRDSDLPGQISPIVPPPGSDLIFANFDMGVNVPCTNLQNFGGGEYNVVHVTPYYTSTITLSHPLQTKALQVANGTIDQPDTADGTDITVDGAYPVSADPADPFGSTLASFWWTGGTINNIDHTSQTAGLRVIGSGTTGLIDFGDGTEWDTADTLKIESTAKVSFTSGTVLFTAGNGVDIGENCVFTVTTTGVPPSRPPALSNVSTGLCYVTINPGGVCDVLWDWESELPIYNNAGRLHLGEKITATITNPVGGVPGVYQVNNDNSKTELDGGSVLSVTDGGMEMAGGSLWIRPTANWQISTIGGNFTMSGGFIQYDLRAFNTAVGSLKVLGDVTWSGGTYNAGYDATRNGKCTYWECTGTMTITGGPGGATVNPVKVNGPGSPKTDWLYLILHADNGITGTPDNAGAATIDLVPQGVPGVLVVGFALVAP